jgi:CRP-like cAMP-binding protein
MSTPVSQPGFTENKILAALNSTAQQRFLSQLERVSLSQGDVIYEADAPIDYVYFPETAIFSMLTLMKDGSTVEVGPVGNEGMVGLRIFLGADTSLDQVIVHVAGSAMRLRSDVLRKELCCVESPMPSLLLRYTQMLLAMTSQSGGCYKLHSLEQNLARWLLMMHDYMGGDDLLLTHDLIALTLGVRRSGVTEASLELKNSGLMDYHRGRIQILDREGLKARACECYQEIKDEYDLLYADLSKFSK